MKTARFARDDDPVARDERAAIAHLRADHDARVIASPAAAARETAAWIATAFEIDHAFSDIDYGRWRGHAIRDIAEQEPQGIAAWLSTVDARPHGGESIAMFARRIAKALARVTCDASCRRCIIVTHAIVVKAAVAHARGEPIAAMLSMDFAPLSSISLEYDAMRDAWSVSETS